MTSNSLLIEASALQTDRMSDETEQGSVARASVLMRHTLLLLDASGLTLAATHLEQALHLATSELALRGSGDPLPPHAMLTSPA